ncbi:MAG: hypothetical protein A2864_00150 [Candidatus Woykebacteria bacterium RIFCSPHIGHO2_01_FULL_39_12]|uniref:Uncharacterized protein n=1 Tax=Candidatus Woykebacteria bacterium RIFCSPHIGHO2_01_FULL_39_12 TaxID=1802599 RepID=A0A1G1WJT9_9BACT|nr:MAG: hypothetical protein A2864_00150 [Candidatus Woykebacteria bacterium RIFCSPHIGHO2_01_FULL_39_12]
MVLLLFGALILNFGISWFNAWSVGRAWVESKTVGGWLRFMVWCGAIMSAAGFTWCYTLILAMIAGALGWLTEEYVEGLVYLGYLLVIFPVLGSGIAIWADSVARAWRQRNILNAGLAGWNTFAMIYNSYNAISAVPDAIAKLVEIFFKGRSSSKEIAMAFLVILLAIVALGGGIITTTMIIRATARSQSEGMALRRELALGR